MWPEDEQKQSQPPEKVEPPQKSSELPKIQPKIEKNSYEPDSKMDARPRKRPD
ncbi:MAG: hypothetical protein AMXMBFR23_08050 [Chloroflexota bacterium]